MSETYDIVIVGAGIAGGALAAVLARGGAAVAVLERDPVPIDRVRGEIMAPWGVAELQRLGLFDTLAAAGAVFPRRIIPYDENLPGEAAHPFALDLSVLVPGVPGPLCLSHPAMCAALAAAAEAGRGHHPARRREHRRVARVAARGFLWPRRRHDRMAAAAG